MESLIILMKDSSNMIIQRRCSHICALSEGLCRANERKNSNTTIFKGINNNMEEPRPDITLTKHISAHVFILKSRWHLLYKKQLEQIAFINFPKSGSGAYMRLVLQTEA